VVLVKTQTRLTFPLPLISEKNPQVFLLPLLILIRRFLKYPFKPFKISHPHHHNLTPTQISVTSSEDLNHNPNNQY
jgi:hypothetical protein